MALIKKSSDISLGTLIGSNITNPLFALSIGMISTYPVSSSLIWIDIPFWFLISLLGFWFFWKKTEITRRQASWQQATWVFSDCSSR